MTAVCLHLSGFVHCKAFVLVVREPAGCPEKHLQGARDYFGKQFLQCPASELLLSIVIRTQTIPQLVYNG